MTNCIICHKVLGDELLQLWFRDNTKDFVCICFDCIKKQNKN